MCLKSRLAIAAAIVLGSSTFALAQTAQYDYSSESTISFGPVKQAPGAARASRVQTQLNSGPSAKYDYTSEQTLSYGAPAK